MKSPRAKVTRESFPASHRYGLDLVSPLGHWLRAALRNPGLHVDTVVGSKGTAIVALSHPCSQSRRLEGHVFMLTTNTSIGDDKES